MSALYRLGRDFILKAYNALTSLLGDALAKIAGEKITGWIKEHTSTEHLAGWLKTQYAVDQTSAELKREISTSSDIGKMQSALERVETLSMQFGRQIDLERKLIKAMDYVRMIPGVTTSNGITLLAAGYILICGYSVFAAADYVDAAALQLLNRIAGIPTVIRQNL